MVFEDIELNPAAAALGIVGGLLSIFVMKNVAVSIFWKIASFILTSIVCYFVVNNIVNK